MEKTNTLTIFLEDGYYQCDYNEIEDEKLHRIFSLTIPKNDNYEECIQDKYVFKQAISEFNESKKEKTNITYEEFFKDYELNIKGTKEDIIYFIKNNNINCKKIIVSEANQWAIDIRNKEFINKLLEELGELENIYVIGDGNEKEISLKEYKETIHYIDNIADKIRSLNLSPLEELMYLYDNVRDREYKVEDKDEDYTESRDLSSVIKGNKIVCVGFSQIFDKVAKELGFKTRLLELNSKIPEELPSHIRNMVYIEDDKYNVKGIYTFDLTFDSKNKENTHLDKYEHFAKPLLYYYLSKEEGKIFEYLKIEELISAVVKIKNNQKEKLIQEELTKINSVYYSFFNEYLIDIFDIVDIKKLSKESKEEICNKILNFFDLFNKPIDVQKFADTLIEVRGIEYQENSKKYHLSVEKVLKIIENSKLIRPTNEEVDESKIKQKVKDKIEH